MDLYLEKTINRLLINNQRVAQGFIHAGEKIGNKILKSLFLRLAEVHQQFADELRLEILLENGDPQILPQPSIGFSNLLQEVRYLMTGKNGALIISKCARDHRAILKKYFMTLEAESLPVVVRNTVVRQWRTLKDIVEIIRLEKVLAL